MHDHVLQIDAGGGRQQHPVAAGTDTAGLCHQRDIQLAELALFGDTVGNMETRLRHVQRNRGTATFGAADTTGQRGIGSGVRTNHRHLLTVGQLETLIPANPLTEHCPLLCNRPIRIGGSMVAGVRTNKTSGVFLLLVEVLGLAAARVDLGTNHHPVELVLSITRRDGKGTQHRVGQQDGAFHQPRHLGLILGTRIDAAGETTVDGFTFVFLTSHRRFREFRLGVNSRDRFSDDGLRYNRFNLRFRFGLDHHDWCNRCVLDTNFLVCYQETALTVCTHRHFIESLLSNRRIHLGCDDRRYYGLGCLRGACRSVFAHLKDKLHLFVGDGGWLSNHARLRATFHLNRFFFRHCLLQTKK